MPQSNSSGRLPGARFSLTAVWEVYSKHKEYLGTVRRVERSGATVYEPERKDGKPVRPPEGSPRSLGWPTKDSAAAALVLSYR
ncbi:hypothetical protein [Saccharopolyspora taberi]|uniref:Uncharacterized protein n=1 Tax=Saccharopolyspora taberi TaxID=60895 RepID=A0ABN3VLG7_9PSEU